MVVCQRVFVSCCYEGSNLCYDTLVKVILISYPGDKWIPTKKAQQRDKNWRWSILKQADPIMSYYYSLFANEETDIQFNIYACLLNISK